MWLRFVHVNHCSILGGRGVTLQRYLNIGGNNLDDLFSDTEFPDNPDYYSVNPSFQSEFVRCGCLSIGLSVHSLFSD